MKKILLYSSIIFTIIIVVIFTLNSEFFVKRRVNKLLNNAGGVNIIKKEASSIFKQMRETKEPMSIPENERSINALSSIGLACPGNTNLPSYIRINIGTHFRTKFIFIFDPSEMTYWHDRTGLIKISDNIYYEGSIIETLISLL